MDKIQRELYEIYALLAISTVGFGMIFTGLLIHIVLHEVYPNLIVTLLIVFGTFFLIFAIGFYKLCIDDE
jgi:hypothetical protein